MNQLLKPEILSSQNKWFCPSCNLLSESTRETCIINSVPILIIQLCWSSNHGGQLVKNENFFSCTQNESNKDLTVPITIEDKISFTSKYFLNATINHSGTLNRSNYWAFIKNLHFSSRYSCNDNSVFNAEENSVNNTTSLILLYTKFMFFPGSTKNFCGFARGFCHLRLCLWLWQPHI